MKLKSRSAAIVVSWVIGEALAGIFVYLPLLILGAHWLIATVAGALVGAVAVVFLRINLDPSDEPRLRMEGIIAPCVEAVDLDAIGWKAPKLGKRDKLVEAEIERPLAHVEKMIVVIKANGSVVGYDRPIILTPDCHLQITHDNGVGDHDMPPLRTTRRRR